MVAAFFDPRNLCFTEPTQRPQHPSLVPYLPVRCPDTGSVCWKPVDGAPVLPLRRPDRIPAGLPAWSWEEEAEERSGASADGGELIYLFDQDANDDQADRYHQLYEQAYAVYEPTTPYDFQD